jgi:hypothetical protein
MTQSPVNTEIHQAFDVHGDLATDIAFDFIVPVHDFSDF